MFCVRVADLKPEITLSPEEQNGILANALKSGHDKYVSADLHDKAQVLKAIDRAEVVFRMAAPNLSINNHMLHYSVTVLGTKNIIDIYVELKVKRLIYTSSASVVFDGIHGIFDGDESLPYSDKPLDSYSATKVEGEAAILKENGTNGLLTCSLRPSSIFGSGDRLFVPSLVAAARAGISKALMVSSHKYMTWRQNP